jgi:hypothetical protein
MSTCHRCGSDYSSWNAAKRPEPAFFHVCDSCVAEERRAQQQIEESGLPALAVRYVPNTMLQPVGLAIWDSTFSRLESMAGKLGTMLLTAGFGSASTQHNVGLVGASETELFLVTLKLIDDKDTFDYRKIDDHLLPAHYRKSSGRQSRIRRVPLAGLTAALKLEKGYAVLQLAGTMRNKLLFDDNLCPGNREAAGSVADRLNATRAT